MSEMTWFPFDGDAYDTDTVHLTPAQDGIYGRLLRYYYRTRMPLPDNDQALASIARIGLEEWLQYAPFVRPFFVPKRGRLHQKRADRELNHQDSVTKKNSKKAQKAALVRWGKIKALDATGIGQAMLADATIDSREERVRDSETIHTTESELESSSQARAQNVSQGATVEDDPDSIPITKPPVKPTRIAEDWTPSEVLRAYATHHNVDPDKATEEFVNYWLGVGGSKGCKLNWSATFRNRIVQLEEAGRFQITAPLNGKGPHNGKRTYLDLRDDIRARVEAQRASDGQVGPGPDGGPIDLSRGSGCIIENS